MEKEQTIGDRLQLLRVHLRYSQSKFGKLLDRSGPNISKIESGENPLSENLLDSLELKLNANRSWLLTGEGEMFLTKKDDSKGFSESWAKNLLNDFKSSINDEMRKKDEEISWLRAQMTTLIANVGKLTATSENAMSVFWNEDYKMTGSGNF